MRWALEDPRAPVAYDDQFREYYIMIRDSADPDYGSAVNLSFCPFTGERLPESLRNEWFETLEGFGIDISIGELNDPRVPTDMRTGQWWRSRGHSAN